MNNSMKIALAVLGGLFLLSTFSTCNRRSSKPATTEVIAQEYAKGLDLKMVADLAKNSKTAADFERSLNSSSKAVNNIDLNDDGKVDYINVKEYGNGDSRGFSLTTEISPGKVQEIATIQFTKNGNTVDMDVAGNSSLYGNGHRYRSSFGLTDVLLYSWLFSEMRRPHYASPYGYGHYPSSFNRNWSRKPNAAYAAASTRINKTSKFSAGSTPSANKIKSPNASKSAVRANILANPQKSQRSFSQRSGKTSSSRSRSGGFGRSSSFSGRSGSSFGGGK